MPGGARRRTRRTRGTDMKELPMSEELIQEGQAADGHGQVLFVPVIADLDKPTVAELTAEGVVPLTYGLTPDGFQHSTTIATITTGRYTLAQALEKDGVITDTLEVTYVYSRETPTEVEIAIGKQGVVGNIVHILGYENGHELAPDDKINAIIPMRTSVPRDVPPTQNTELAKVVKCNVTGRVRREVVIAGGV